jgi:hypothetical protein
MKLTQRQLQALAKPCPTVEHLLSTCLQRDFCNFSTLLGVTIDNGRIVWHASVARFGLRFPPGDRSNPERSALLLSEQSPKQIRALEEVGREMLYAADGKNSVGTGKHHVVKGLVGIVVVRQLSEDEKRLLPLDWLVQPTDEEIRRQA